MIGLGQILGRTSVKGVSLGSSGVVFIALLAGHFGFQVSSEVGMVGVVLFIYCLGIGAGPSFLQMFVSRGKTLMLLTVVMMSVTAAVAWGLARIFQLSPDLASGLFAGALTSTP
ncbi:MAG: YidE/YbjL duplication, partial [Gimesia sp.]|nr:YidE/YbjL duplication [Gimesia sp.]HCO22855.1 YidE/YbjL duplication [Gimesia maris]